MAQGTPPGLALNRYAEPTTMDDQALVSNSSKPHAADAGRPAAARVDTNYTMASMMSVPPEGSILTGKQEHCKRLAGTQHMTKYLHSIRPQARTHLSANTIRNI